MVSQASWSVDPVEVESDFKSFYGAFIVFLCSYNRTGLYLNSKGIDVLRYVICLKMFQATRFPENEQETTIQWEFTDDTLHFE